MPDLVSGMFPTSSPLWNALGRPVNVVNGNYPARMTDEILGPPIADTSASLASGVMTAVLVPFDAGNVVTKISIFTGATAASTPTHSFAALYSGTTVAAPPLIAQSTDGLTTAIGASARFDFTLTTPQLITPAQVPYGFLFVAISVTGTTMPSLLTHTSVAAAAQYAYYTNFAGGQTTAAYALTSGSAVAGTAPATLIYASQKLVAPRVHLS